MTMLKTLIAINADLASSLAIRYACQLSKRMTMGLRTIHVHEPDEHEQSPGTGWVRQTWEETVDRINQDKITQMIKTEKATCPDLENPKMVSGERDMQILHELQLNRYDLLVEGILHAFEPDSFFKKIDSELYRNLPCPVLLVKNLVSLEKGFLLLGGEEELMGCMPIFFKIFRKVPFAPDLLCCQFLEKESSKEAKKLQDSGVVVQALEETLNVQGRKSGKIRTIRGTPTSLSPYVQGYGLVISTAQERKSPLTDLLSRSPSPMLLCRF